MVKNDSTPRTPDSRVATGRKNEVGPYGDVSKGRTLAGAVDYVEKSRREKDIGERGKVK